MVCGTEAKKREMSLMALKKGQGITGKIAAEFKVGSPDDCAIRLVAAEFKLVSSDDCAIRLVKAEFKVRSPDDCAIRLVEAVMPI